VRVRHVRFHGFFVLIGRHEHNLQRLARQRRVEILCVQLLLA
jgi:hypothetical protein